MEYKKPLTSHELAKKLLALPEARVAYYWDGRPRGWIDTGYWDTEADEGVELCLGERDQMYTRGPEEEDLF